MKVVPSEQGENAGATPDGETAPHWHHYEPDSPKALLYHWDRLLFRLACYMEASLIHETVEKICSIWRGSVQGSVQRMER